MTRPADGNLLLYLKRYTKKHGYPPSLREILEDLGYSSTSVVTYQLDRLEREGRLTRQRHVARSIVLT
jgi:repressor LexA|tara:strand:+ start:120 stop:323 length:204 start_codon:yes stop_codon:yes gene_type:complete